MEATVPSAATPRTRAELLSGCGRSLGSLAAWLLGLLLQMLCCDLTGACRSASFCCTASCCSLAVFCWMRTSRCRQQAHSCQVTILQKCFLTRFESVMCQFTFCSYSLNNNGAALVDCIVHSDHKLRLLDAHSGNYGLVCQCGRHRAIPHLNRG